MKKRTLNQTWVLCLRMWRHVAKVWTGDTDSIVTIKYDWLRSHGFDTGLIRSHCFFCDFDEGGTCATCPGKLVESSFSCCNPNHHYEHKPVAFYKELLRLNRIRKSKKN